MAADSAVRKESVYYVDHLTHMFHQAGSPSKGILAIFSTTKYMVLKYTREWRGTREGKGGGEGLLVYIFVCRSKAKQSYFTHCR